MEVCVPEGVETLDQDCFERILTYLKSKDITSLACTSRQFRNFVQESRPLWIGRWKTLKSYGVFDIGALPEGTLDLETRVIRQACVMASDEISRICRGLQRTDALSYHGEYQLRISDVRGEYGQRLALDEKRRTVAVLTNKKRVLIYSLAADRYVYLSAFDVSEIGSEVGIFLLSSGTCVVGPTSDGKVKLVYENGQVYGSVFLPTPDAEFFINERMLVSFDSKSLFVWRLEGIRYSQEFVQAELPSEGTITSVALNEDRVAVLFSQWGSPEAGAGTTRLRQDHLYVVRCCDVGMDAAPFLVEMQLINSRVVECTRLFPSGYVVTK